MRRQRTVTVETNAAAQRERGPLRILAAAASFRGRDAGVVVRLNRALPRDGEDRPPLTLGRSIVRNEILPDAQRYYGGITPFRAGRRDRHCYVSEAQQIVPRKAFREGSRLVVAVRRDERLVTVASVTLRAGADLNGRALLRSLGC